MSQENSSALTFEDEVSPVASEAEEGEEEDVKREDEPADGESLGGSEADAADAAADKEEDEERSDDEGFICEEIITTEEPQAQQEEVEEEEAAATTDDESDEEEYCPGADAESTDSDYSVGRFVPTDEDGHPLLTPDEWQDWAGGVVYGVRRLRNLLLTSATGIPSAQIREWAQLVLESAAIDEEEFGVDPEEIPESDDDDIEDAGETSGVSQ